MKIWRGVAGKLLGIDRRATKLPVYQGHNRLSEHHWDNPGHVLGYTDKTTISSILIKNLDTSISRDLARMSSLSCHLLIRHPARNVKTFRLPRNLNLLTP